MESFHRLDGSFGPGALYVVIESSSGERVNPVITGLTPILLEVRYRPLEPGNYSVTLQWGQVPIPGSPFQVKCYSPVMCLSVMKQPPAELSLGISIQFILRPLGARFRWIKPMVSSTAQSCHVRGEGTTLIFSVRVIT